MKKTHNKYKNQINHSKHLIKFGSFGFKSKSFFRLTKQKHILLFNLILKKIKLLTNNSKQIKIWNRLVFNQNLTKLPLESRMGKGKGAIYENASFLLPGSIIFEFTGLTKENLSEILFFIKSRIGKNIILVSRYNN